MNKGVEKNVERGILDQGVRRRRKPWPPALVWLAYFVALCLLAALICRFCGV